MSGQKHATVSLWQRDAHDGSYAAELAGWKLHVKWTPEREPGSPHGFSWSAARAVGGGDGDAEEEALGPSELFEEMSVAMSTAEDAVTKTDSRDRDKSGA